MAKLESDLHIAMNRVWRGSYGEGSTFSLHEAGKETVSDVKALCNRGYVEDLFEVPGVNPGINGKITDKGRGYCQEHFGNPPIRL